MNFPVSNGERELLRRLIEAEENDDPLTEFRPGGWMVGTENVSGKVCWRLIRHALIESDSLAPPCWGDCKYWYVNETGRKVVDDPNYVPWTVRMANGETGPFFD